ncbi:MAG: hypothetical protein Q8K77_03370 [Thermodesulfovibrionales bacterium]|nr:hypothetical protein [Thermodesulfovibrionales bacterium]
MGIAAGADYKKELINIARDLPDRDMKEVLDFVQFLKAKKEGFSYMQIKDSVESVRALRMREGKRVKSGKRFIEELIAWQKSES